MIKRHPPVAEGKTAASMAVSMPKVWFAAHAGSRSLAVVFVNLGHHSLKLVVGLLKEGENRRGDLRCLPLHASGTGVGNTPGVATRCVALSPRRCPASPQHTARS